VQNVVHSIGQQVATVCTKLDARYRVPVSLKGKQDLVCAQVPTVDEIIETAAEGAGAIVGKGDRRDGKFVL